MILTIVDMLHLQSSFECRVSGKKDEVSEGKIELPAQLCSAQLCSARQSGGHERDAERALSEERAELVGEE